jgi:N6-adenosine-specific RNA methylase IME4
MKYKTIYADPPWPEKGGGKIKRGADRHYPLMKIKEIMDLQAFISSIADDNSHLYLWATNNFLKDALIVMETWGYRYVTTITWIKDKTGLGQYYRGITEHCLFGVKGSIPYKIIDGKRCQGKTGFYAPRNEHSKKPEEMRKMIEIVSPGPYIELFARQKTPGWDVWGNEVKSDIELLIPKLEEMKKNALCNY